MSFLIDTHCHLNYDYEGGKTPADLIRECKENGVDYLITIGTDQAGFEAVQKISESFPNVFHTIGIHPHEADEVTPEVLKFMRPFLDHPKCVAVGEIGLDYYYDHSDRKKQQQECIAQAELALDVKKPIVIHSRDFKRLCEEAFGYLFQGCDSLFFGHGSVRARVHGSWILYFTLRYFYF